MIPADSPIFWIGSIAIWSIIPATLIFVIRYLTKSPWRSEPIGKAIMSLMICVFTILVIGLAWTLVRVVYENPANVWVQLVMWLRMILNIAVAGVFWWLLGLLIKIQDREREVSRPQS